MKASFQAHRSFKLIPETVVEKITAISGRREYALNTLRYAYITGEKCLIGRRVTT